MPLCSKCKKNVAVIFVMRYENNSQVQQGLCMPCAKVLGIDPIEHMAGNMDQNTLENLSAQMNDLFLDPEFGVDTEQNAADSGGSPFGGLLNFLSGKRPEEEQQQPHQPKSTQTREKKSPLKKKRLLDSYGVNLTALAKEGKVDRVIGRQKEIDRVIQILNRRAKNNPVLIGEPGVGKTAIAEGLSMRIVEKNVPAKLLATEIYMLDFTALVAGTQFRGQFEARLKSVLDETKKLGNIVLVIDELHNIVSAGEAEGAMNAANILKPSLARGEIQVIGATTLDEYRKHIEKDSALERRFQPVLVEEPSVEETIEIIEGVRDYYEAFHKVKITKEVIRIAAILSERYITERFLPDKAIDVIDEAGSKANLRNKQLVRLTELNSELKQVQAEKDEAVNEDSIENYQRAADLKMWECRLRTEISQIENNWEDIFITPDDVAEVIELWTKIPVQRITELETNRLLNLEERLHRRLVGQDTAVGKVAQAIRRNRAGLSKKRRPASFIFLGNSGVGKTELVKALAEALFDSEEALIRMDMSEYMEKHAVSKIIGSPPGYVGYDDAGQLTEKVRRRPYSVILLDEIEKAHPDIFNILLQILDDGRITDSRGKVINFENTVIIMTSNLGSDWKTHGIGFSDDEAGDQKSKVDRALKSIFRPEFLNRVDEIVIFDKLSRDNLRLILNAMIAEFEEMLAEKGISLRVSDAAIDYLVRNGFGERNGARPLRRLLQREVENIVAEMVISGALSEGSCAEIDIEEQGEPPVAKIVVKIS